MNNSKNDVVSTFPATPHKMIVAEKPSVAQAIAKALGVKERKDGYLQGGGYIISWCIGHLVGLAAADLYAEKYAKWRYTDLPILPDRWLLTTNADTRKQFNVLMNLMNENRVTSLICATDAGREGELIFRFVYEQARCKKPFERLWISSMEDKAILDGFANLKDGSAYDNLYASALCRARADWLVGINATRLYSVLYNHKLIVGRVQSPTLAMLVDELLHLYWHKVGLWWFMESAHDADGYAAVTPLSSGRSISTSEWTLFIMDSVSAVFSDTRLSTYKKASLCPTASR